MKYYLFIDNTLEKEDEDLQEIKYFVYNFIDENMTEEAYDESWDECYEEIKIGCCTFTPSEIMKKCDPVAYRCGWSDYCNCIAQDLNYMLENNGEDSWGGYDFELLALETEIEIDKKDLNLKNDINEEISDYLSNISGYCVFDYDVEETKESYLISNINWDVE